MKSIYTMLPIVAAKKECAKTDTVLPDSSDVSEGTVSPTIKEKSILLFYFEMLAMKTLPLSRNDEYDDSIVTLLSTGATAIKVNI